MKRAISLGDVQQTLLVPLYCRAAASRAEDGVLPDPAAVAIVESLDYDFTTFRDDATACGSVWRTIVLDEWVRRFRAHDPGGTIVELGAGLSTRCVRLDNAALHWVAVDFADVVALRRCFLPDDSRRISIAGSAQDDGWVPVVLAHPPPYFVVLEGVLVYLDTRTVREVTQVLAGSFPGAMVAFDAADAATLAALAEHPMLRQLNVRLRWACDESRELEREDSRYQLLDSWSLVEALANLPWRLPVACAAATAIARTLSVGAVEGFRCNRYRIRDRAVCP